MMQLINNITDIYNQHPFITTHHNMVSVYELNNADTRQIDICRINTDFHLLEQSFYKNQHDITDGKSKILKDKDCDGIIFYESHEKQHLLGVELKSGFSGQEIRGGYAQIFFTFLKLYTFLSVCDDFDFSKYDITAYLACQPIKNKADEAKFLDNLQMKKMAGEAFSISDSVIYNYILSIKRRTRKNQKYRNCKRNP